MLAPSVEQRESASAAAGTTECEIHAAINPAAHGQTSDYDLAIDLGLGHITSDTSVSRYDMSDADYFTLMKSFNREQLEFVYDTVHHLKTSQQPLYRFLSGGAGTGRVTFSELFVKWLKDTSKAGLGKISNSIGQ